MSLWKAGDVVFAKASSYTRIFHAVYDRRRVSKQGLADALGLSLPTVTAGLRALERDSLIRRQGTHASTGGRPAIAYELVADARFAIGVEIVAERARIAAVDLYGTTLAHHDEPLPFRRSETYFAHVTQLVATMAEELSNSHGILLGITIAIQGIVDDAGHVTFGGLLGADNVQVSLDDFARHLTMPLRFVHDAEAAAFAELWRHRDLTGFAYLSLNDHLGSAVVLGGRLLQGGSLGAGVIEHMTLYPTGRQCYCGNTGCAETLVGVRALEQRARMPLGQFFDLLRAGDTTCTRLWSSYLSDLALLIHNVRMVTCTDVMIGGRLARHINETDLRVLRTRATSHGALSATPFHLVRGQYGDQATVVGAALLLVDECLKSV